MLKIFVIAMIVIFASTAFFPRLSFKDSTEADVAKNRATLAQCTDPRVCVGGFIRWKNSSRVSRIAACESRECGTYEVALSTFDVSAPAEYISRIGDIVLPFGDRSRWDSAAADFSRQFVIQRDVRQ